MDDQEKIEKLEKDVQFYSKKYFELREEYIKLEKSSIKFKIKKRTDKFLSVIVVFLSSSEEGVTLWDRLGMFFKTIWSWARNGFKLEEEQITQSRLEICEDCPHLIKPSYQCKMCGCMMKKKTKLSGASCPLSKW